MQPSASPTETESFLAAAVGYFAQARNLSKREHEIVHLAARGLVDKQIATHLGLAYTTIKCYWKRIFQKLAVPNRQLVLAQLLASLAEMSEASSRPAVPATLEPALHEER